MAEAAGGAPATGATGGDQPALPEGMLSMPKVTTVSKKKMDAYDLENDVDDKPIEQKPDYADDNDSSNNNKSVVKEKKPVKKAEAEAIDDDEDEVEEESEEDEDDKPVKPRKKRALEITNEDDEDEEDGETSEEEVEEEAATDAEDPSKVDPKLLNKKYKITVKGEDGKETIKDYSLKQLFDMAQKNESGDMKLYQAAEFYKKTQGIIDRLQTDPFEILEYIAGKNEQNYYNMIEGEMARLFKLNHTMTPEERQAYVQAENDKKELSRYRQDQADLKLKADAEATSKSNAEAANTFIDAVGSIIQTEPYLQHVYDNLEEGEDKNYIFKKFLSFAHNGQKMKAIPEGQPNHLPAAFDLSPKNPIIVKLVIDEIKKEAAESLKQAGRAAKFIGQTEKAETIVNKAGTKTREKIPGVKTTPGKVKKATSKEKAAKKQSTWDFLRSLDD